MHSRILDEAMIAGVVVSVAEGNDGPDNDFELQHIETPEPIIEVEPGCVLGESGRAYCWEVNEAGQSELVPIQCGDE